MDRRRLALAIALALAAAADNATTWIAVQRGARETNPLVAPFLGDPILFLAFSVAKSLAALAVAYASYSDSYAYHIVYFAVMTVFLHACIVNIANAVAP